VSIGLLPVWVGVTWTATFLAALSLHVWHMVTTPGRARVWHAAHVLMATGMIDMYWPGHPRFGAGGAVFAVAVAGVLAMMVADLSRPARVVGRWLITAVDLAAMVYMFAAMSHPVEAVTTALVLWFGIEALGWAFGLLETAPEPPCRCNREHNEQAGAWSSVQPNCRATPAEAQLNQDHRSGFQEAGGEPVRVVAAERQLATGEERRA
jgi:hypothetical protein